MIDTNPIYASARRWLGRHRGEHLHRDRHIMVERGVRVLRQAFNLPHDAAERIVLQALGDVEARASAAYIDTARSTQHAVFLVDPLRNRTVVFTAQDLLDRARSASTPALAVNAGTGAIRAAY